MVSSSVATLVKVKNSSQKILPAVCVGRLLANSRPFVGQQLAYCRPTIFVMLQTEVSADRR